VVVVLEKLLLDGTGVAGTANTGGGGGGSGGGTFGGVGGGSGIVIVKEPALTTPISAPGVWGMNAVYDNVENGTWTN